MNQPEMADALKVSVATVSRICSGERRPSTDLMIEIRRVLSWSVEAQVDAITKGTYADSFKSKMERRQVGGRVARS
jgi:transcriptional regulator with XRE-family HTH domain